MAHGDALHFPYRDDALHVQHYPYTAPLTWPTIDDTLIAVGVDPATPVDRLPMHAQVALATHYWDWENGEELNG